MAENIYLFVPNIICYVRALLTVASFWHMRSNYVVAFWCYVLGVALDEVDGNAARAFNQCSRWGTILDMLVDKFANIGLLMMLSILYQDYFMVFQMLLSLEALGTWLQMYSSLIIGQKSHKDVSTITNPIVRMYYGKKWFFNSVIYGQESFWILLYLNYFNPGPEVALAGYSIGLFRLLCALVAPIQMVKVVINVARFYAAPMTIVNVDRKERLAHKQ